MSNPTDELRRPHIDRTSFTPVVPPRETVLHICPACGMVIRGSYNLEPARKSCTKTWHLAEPVPYEYVQRGVFAPPMAVLVKLGSVIRHIQEGYGEGGHALDIGTVEVLMADPDVMGWVEQMDELALLPVMRS